MAKSPWRALLLGLTLLLSACGGGGGGSTSGGTSGYTVGGTLSGLATGQRITLNNKSTGESLTLSASGSFAFATTQATGANYAVTVSAQPTGQSCRVTDGLGVVGSANVTSIAVTCTSQYTVSAAVSGLSGSQTVKLVDNSVDFQTASTSTATITFSQALANGQAYNVAVAAQPAGAVCQVGTNASGVISSANAMVTVSCNTSPSPEFLYAGTTSGAVGVSGYSIDVANGGTGTLAAVNSVSGSSYYYPVAMAVDQSGADLYVVAGDGITNNSVNPLALAMTTGVITTPNPSKPTGNNPYGVAVTPLGNFVYVANSSDNTISMYTSSSGALTPNGSVSSAGVNPESIVINPAGTFLYVLNYGSDTVTTFAINSSTGGLTQVGAPVATGVNPYGVQASVTPGGGFLYVANYGSNSISAYSLGSNGLPSPIAGSPFAAGANPFAVTISPAGTFAYVANETDNSVLTYSIDPTYGTLTPVGGPTSTGANSNPEGVVVDPSGQYLYVSAYNTNAIEQFAINPGTGALNLVSPTAATLPGSPRPLVAVRR